MSWETIYTVDVEETGARIINETSFTGHTIRHFREGGVNPFATGDYVEIAEILADLMNDVYNQVKKDFNNKEENT